ncbi:MAG: hypothetical protein HOP28_13095 [Gemmatimonadales bacterium]|nr:hypothetical protein [Gemmatimonadales bacterium]
MNELLALGTAVTLGFVHAIELDHMVAVTAFVSKRPRLLTALGFGFRWGLGHSIAVFLAGALLLATGVRLPPSMTGLLEGTVGIALVAVGIWSLRTAPKLHLHAPQEHGDPRAGITAVGLLHGLAGTTAAVALVPVTLIHSVWLGIGYLLAFGIGVTVGMSLFAIAAAVAIRQAAERSLLLGRRLAGVAGVASLCVGLWWLARAWFQG